VAIKEKSMATLVVLSGFTDQGIRNVKETIGRVEAFKEMAKKSGVLLRSSRRRTTRSRPALSLSVSSRGNVRSQTLRAFSFDEMKTILSKMV
jgi:uncharacterized protein with GYD domain